MTIMNLYAQTVQTQTQTALVQPARVQDIGEDFSAYFSTAEESAAARPVPDRDRVQPAVQKDRPAAKPDQRDQAKDMVLERDAVNQSEKGKIDAPERKEAPEKPKAEAVAADENRTGDQQEEEWTEEDFAAAEREMTEKLAQSLGLSVEKIQQILASLAIKPLALTDKAVFNQFIQKVCGAQTPAELLTLPNAQETFGKAQRVTAEFEAVGKAFLDRLENESIGKPQFIDAGSQSETVLLLSSDEGTGGKAALAPADAAGEQPEDSGDAQAVRHTTPSAAEPEQQSAGQNNAFGDTDQSAVETAMTAEHTPDTVDAVWLNTASAANATRAAAVEKAAVLSEAARNINTDDVIRQIVEKVKVEVKGDVTEMKLSLRPEHLGDVTLKISAQNGIVTAQFMAESQRIKEIIEAGFQTLRDTLEQQGIQISQLSVSVGQENAEKQMGYFNGRQGQQPIRRADAIAGAPAAQPTDLAENYLNDSAVYDIQVDYKA